MDVHLLESCKLVYKLRHGQCPVSIRNLFRFVKHGHDTRGGSLSNVKHTSHLVNQSFLSKPFMAWNDVPSCIQHELNVKKFSKLYKKKLILKY